MNLELTRRYYPGGTNSCIPGGNYRLLTGYNHKFNTHFLPDVATDRTLILIHPANDAVKELRGGIAPVMSLSGPGKGAQSVTAMEKIKQVILGDIESAPVFINEKRSK